MSMRTKQKERRTFTLSAHILSWLEKKAKEDEISRSELVDRVLDRYYQEEKQERLEEGYRALADVLESTARTSSHLQKKTIPGY